MINFSSCDSSKINRIYVLWDSTNTPSQFKDFVRDSHCLMFIARGIKWVDWITSLNHAWDKVEDWGSKYTVLFFTEFLLTFTHGHASKYVKVHVLYIHTVIFRLTKSLLASDTGGGNIWHNQSSSLMSIWKVVSVPEARCHPWWMGGTMSHITLAFGK